jgi:hypothetical protein
MTATQAVLGYANESSDSPAFSATGIDRHHAGAVLAGAVVAHPELSWWLVEDEDSDEAEGGES